MPGFFIPPGALSPGGLLNRAPIPFWGLNKDGKSANQAPLFATDPWDTFWIGASPRRQFPGECVLEPGGVSAIEVVKKKAKGSDNAKWTLVGRDSKEFRITVQLVTPEHWAELQDIKNTFWRIPNKTNNLADAAIPVSHPGLDFVNIYSAVLKAVSPPVEGKLEGAGYVTFTFLEANKQGTKNVTKTADSPPPPEDARKPGSALLAPANAPPPPPEAVAANLSTEGPR
jgi:hypothetical protein